VTAAHICACTNSSSQRRVFEAAAIPGLGRTNNALWRQQLSGAYSWWGVRVGGYEQSFKLARGFECLIEVAIPGGYWMAR
jgi:hypothetical protein